MADLYLEFSNGSVTIKAAWEESYSHYGLELMTPNGVIRYDSGSGYVTWHKVVQDLQFPRSSTLESNPLVMKTEINRYQYNVYDQLSYAISGRPAFICTGADALATLQSIDGALSVT